MSRYSFNTSVKIWIIFLTVITAWIENPSHWSARSMHVHVYSCHIWHLFDQSRFSHRSQVSLNTESVLFLQGLPERTNKILNKLLTSRVMGIKLSDLFSGLVRVTIRLKSSLLSEGEEGERQLIMAACSAPAGCSPCDSSEIVQFKPVGHRSRKKGRGGSLCVYVCVCMCVTERERGLRGELDWDNIIFSASPGNCASFCSI